MHNIKKTVILSIDLDGQTPYLWKTKGNCHIDLCEYAQRMFGPIIGCQRVLLLLDELQIKATFFIPSYILQNYPKTIEEIRAGGHEIALHGHIHEDVSNLSVSDNIKLLKKTIQLFRQYGLSPMGFRAPCWKMPNYYLDLLNDFGLSYDSSIPVDLAPFKFHDIIELPVSWSTDDAAMLLQTVSTLENIIPLTPQQFLRRMQYECDISLSKLNYIMLTLHPWISGKFSILTVWQQLLQRLRERNDINFQRCVDCYHITKSNIPINIRDIL